MSDNLNKYESGAHIMGCPACIINENGEVVADQSRCVGCGLCRILDDFEGTSGQKEAICKQQ